MVFGHKQGLGTTALRQTLPMKIDENLKLVWDTTTTTTKQTNFRAKTDKIIILASRKTLVHNLCGK